ncbi:MAG: hypothetical protein ACI376_08770 [Candidatus Bruticola sp.]
MNKSFAVGYSGGLDSTLLAFIFGRYYASGQVHLLTALHSIGHIFTGWSQKHVRDLRCLLGEDRVSHHYAKIGREFKKLVLEGCLSTYEQFGRSNFFVCLGCSLAMDVHMICYCLEHMVPVTFWGYTPRGSDFAAVGLPETCLGRRKIYSKFGLLYRVPLAEWHMEKEEERDIYKQFNIWPGWRFRKIAMGVQPPCLWGITMHHLDICFEIHPQIDRKQVTSFIENRTPMVEELVYDRLAERGINDIEKRIAALRCLNESDWEKYGPSGALLDEMEERRLVSSRANIPSLAAKKFKNTIPLFDHETLSRDGRYLKTQTGQ